MKKFLFATVALLSISIASMAQVHHPARRKPVHHRHHRPVHHRPVHHHPVHH